MKQTTDLPAVPCLALFALFFICFGIGMVFIGFPLGVLLASIAIDRNRIGGNASKTRINHIAELLKYHPPFLIYFSAKLCILYSLLFQKIKLLVQKFLLKNVGQATGDPCTDDCAEDCSSNTDGKRVNCLLGHNISANVKATHDSPETARGYSLVV